MKNQVLLIRKSKSGSFQTTHDRLSQVIIVELDCADVRKVVQVVQNGFDVFRG